MGKISELKKNMPIKHVLFVYEYLANGLNGKQAYITVYKCKNSVGEANGRRLLRNAQVRKLLGLLQEKKEKKLNITFESQMADLEEVKRKSLREEEVLSRSGNPTGIMRYDSRGVVSAIQEQNKMLGLHAPEKVQHSGEVKVNPLYEEAAEEIAGKVIEKIKKRNRTK